MFIVSIRYISSKDPEFRHTRSFGPFDTFDKAFDWLASTRDQYDTFDGLFRWGSYITKLETPI